MVTNLLNKNGLNFNFNKIVKQTALATRTRARNVSLNKLGCNKNHFLGFINSHLVHYPTPMGTDGHDSASRRYFSSSINYVKIEHSQWEFRGVRPFEDSPEEELLSTNVLVKKSEQELINPVFVQRSWIHKFYVEISSDPINCLTLNFDPSNDLRSVDDIKPLLNQIKNTTLDPWRLHAIITTPEGYHVIPNNCVKHATIDGLKVSKGLSDYFDKLYSGDSIQEYLQTNGIGFISDDGLALEFRNEELVINVRVYRCHDRYDETKQPILGFAGQIAVNNEESASSLNISRVDFLYVTRRHMRMLQEIDQIHDMKSFVMEQNNKK